jgi:hypothetical protein
MWIKTITSVAPDAFCSSRQIWKFVKVIGDSRWERQSAFQSAHASAHLVRPVVFPGSRTGTQTGVEPIGPACRSSLVFSLTRLKKMVGEPWISKVGPFSFDRNDWVFNGQAYAITNGKEGCGT